MNRHCNMTPYRLLIESLTYSLENYEEEEKLPKDFYDSKLKRAEKLLLSEIGPEFIPGESWDIVFGRKCFSEYFPDLTSRSQYMLRDYNLDDEGDHDTSNLWIIGNENQYQITDVTYILSPSNKEYVQISISLFDDYGEYYKFVYSLNDNIFSYSIGGYDFFDDEIYLRNTLDNLLDVSEDDIEQIVNIIKTFKPKVVVR